MSTMTRASALALSIIAMMILLTGCSGSDGAPVIHDDTADHNVSGSEPGAADGPEGAQPDETAFVEEVKTTVPTIYSESESDRELVGIGYFMCRTISQRGPDGVVSYIHDEALNEKVQMDTLSVLVLSVRHLCPEHTDSVRAVLESLR